MKIHHVSLTGFGPFRGSESVDFDAFADDGIFLITGRTGAGKTSILDAITYALFGRIPRYETAAGDKVRSDHLGPTDPCEVTVEFSVTEGRHRVTRRPAFMRPKQRGEGLTPVKAFFEMSALRDGEWVVIETKEGNADKHVSDVLPLSAEQFQQVILLAQGQFQEFLVAGSEKRREVLSKLFDTSRFSAYSADLDEQARVLRRDVEKLSAQLGTHAQTLAKQVGKDVPETVEPATGAGLQEWAAVCLAAQQDEVAQVRVAAQEAVAAFTTARTLHDAAQETARRQRERTVQIERQRALAEQAEAIEAQREQVVLARRAALAQQACAAAARAESLLHEAEAARSLAVAGWRSALDPDAPHDGPSEQEARTAAESLAADLAALEVAARTETSVPGLEAAVVAADQALAAFEEKLTAAADRRAEHTDRLDAVTEREAALVDLLEALSDAPADLQAAREGLQAAQDHDALTTRMGTAVVEQQAAAEASTQAQQARDALVARQYAEYAGVLAAELVDGAPCLVCGGTEHPAPATLAEDHVDAATLETSNEAVARAQAVAQAASGQVARLAAQIEAMEERTAGFDVEAWTLRVKEATVRAEELTALQREAKELQGVRADLTTQIAALTSQVDGAQDERLRLAGVLTSAQQSVVDALAAVESARGEFTSVAERRADLQERHRVAQRTESAVRAGVEAAGRRDEAVLAMAEALSEQGFADAAAVAEASLAPEELQRLAAAVTTHDQQTAAVADRLAAEELQNLPADPVQLDDLVTALERAAAVHSDAVLALGAAENKAATVADVVAGISAALTGSAAARAEYEVVNALAATLRGQGQNEKKMAIEAFALAAELEEIVAAANLRLAKMTAGRFEFRHSDTEDSKRVASGLGLDVLDAHTGEARSPKSLSGGEKFQASLALALGLAEVVTARAGGLRLDTLFIDEGFGTLDPETLESTMATLDGLREGGRTVGLISHVAAMKESIACQLYVDVTPGGWSTVRQQ
ncbi:AAA family ATPase [Nocardioides yefusunii]|uniref:Nuclease SbcCD subunit C n=1 Tax=Nocardioides yefusunii TaxID=2500546 RepID=A0ABW1QRS0_9ACTN|nr:SMC family ATPase [Nocardioides yefusunii]